MSVLVFAGAAQFVGVPMLAAGAAPLAIVLAVPMVPAPEGRRAGSLAEPRLWGAVRSSRSGRSV